MKLLNNTAEMAEVCLTWDELCFLHQAMNEVCNGVDIVDSEFQTRLGYERVQGEPLMDGLNEALVAIEAERRVRG